MIEGGIGFQQKPFERGNSQLRIHVASAGDDQLYSWVLIKGDSAVHGRWWITGGVPGAGHVAPPSAKWRSEDVTDDMLCKRCQVSR